MIRVNGIWEQETELVQQYVVQNISLICDNSVTIQNVWFFRRIF